MGKTIKFFLLILVAMMILPMAMATGEEKPRTLSRVSHSGKMVINKIIQIDIDHKGVKLDAVTFSGDEALLVAWNGRPSSVKASAAIALFDANNRLIAAESNSGSIRSGKQANFKIKFKKFLLDFKGVTHFHLVFVIEEK